MVHLQFSQASLDFPLLGTNAKSLRSRLLPSRVGGVLGNSSRHTIVRALDDVNLSIQEGDRVGLLGQNGSGKTTLLRVASGVYQPTSGSVNRLGTVGSLIDISLGFNPEATGRDNIYLRAALLGIPKKKIKSLFDEIADFTELGDFIEMPVRTFSSGMQMRLAFAVSTLIQPEILLMDEWLSVGDESFREKAEARLSDVVKQSRILLLASHSRDLIERTCTHAVWLHKGEIRLQGAAKEVCGEYFSWRNQSWPNQ